MTNIERHFYDDDRKYQKSLTYIISIVGRKGPIRLSEIKNEMNMENPGSGGRYVEILVKQLTAEVTPFGERLFCWQDLVTDGEKVEKVKKRLRNKLHKGLISPWFEIFFKDIEIIHEFKMLKGGRQLVRLQVKKNKSNDRLIFEIEYRRNYTDGKLKYDFNKKSFKATVFSKSQQFSALMEFTQKSKGGKLYVYAIDHSPQRTYLIKSIPKDKNRPLYEEIRKYPGISDRISEYGYKSLSFADDIPSRDWEYSLNIRSFIKYLVMGESENKIGKTIDRIWAKPEYGFLVATVNEFNIKPDTLEFPFMALYGYVKQVFYPYFLPNLLKKIVNRISSMIDHISNKELRFLVTYHYFKEVSNILHINYLGQWHEPIIEKIKEYSKLLYDVIMYYEMTILEYLRTFQNQELNDIKSKLDFVKGLT